MDEYEEHLAAKQEGYVLVVDDVPTTRAVHSLILSRHFEVKNAASGDEALQMCAERRPDLVLLDVEMPGLDGFETCRCLRETFDFPIIFATAHESLDEHLKAFDVGGSDLCVKPVSAEILLRKVRLAITQWRERSALQAEKANYLSGLSERRLLLQFARASLHCTSLAQIARNFLYATAQLDIQCCILVRHDGTESAWGADGIASPLERSVLAQIAGMGPIVQFKNRLALNEGCVSVIVSNMPDVQSDEAARIREHMGLLVEMVAALIENLNDRLKSAADNTPASAQTLPRTLMADIRILLHEILDNLEATYDLLATDKHQEERITHAVREPIERILRMLDQHSDML